MIRPSADMEIGVVVGALAFAAVASTMTDFLAPESTADILIELVATLTGSFLAVYVGIWLYWY